MVAMIISRQHSQAECVASAALSRRESSQINISTSPVAYSLDSPLRSQDRGLQGVRFLSSQPASGRFLAFRGPFLRSVAAQKSVIECVILQGLHFPVVGVSKISGKSPSVAPRSACAVDRNACLCRVGCVDALWRGCEVRLAGQEPSSEVSCNVRFLRVTNL